MCPHSPHLGPRKGQVTVRTSSLPSTTVFTFSNVGTGVCIYLTNEGTDKVLIAALAKVLKRRPAECGDFDKIAREEAKDY